MTRRMAHKTCEAPHLAASSGNPSLCSMLTKKWKGNKRHPTLVEHQNEEKVGGATNHVSKDDPHAPLPPCAALFM